MDHEWRVNEMRLDQILLPNSLQKKAVTKFASEGHLGTVLTLKGYSITRMVLWDWDNMVQTEEVEADCLPC